MQATSLWLSLFVLVTALVPEARADKGGDKKRPAAATKADVDRLEGRIEEQQKQIDDAAAAAKNAADVAAAAKARVDRLQAALQQQAQTASAN